MKKGLVLGKFMPLHNGHLSLFDFAGQHCDELVILLCYTDKEPINGALRELWLKDTLAKIPNTVVVSYQYDEHELSGSNAN